MSSILWEARMRRTERTWCSCKARSKCVNVFPGRVLLLQPVTTKSAPGLSLTYRERWSMRRSCRWTWWRVSSWFERSSTRDRWCSRRWRPGRGDPSDRPPAPDHNQLFVILPRRFINDIACRNMFFCRNPGSPSYQIEANNCWTLGWATNCKQIVSVLLSFQSLSYSFLLVFNRKF